MRLLLNIIPLLAFIVVYFLKGIYWATASLIIAQFVQIVIFKLLSYNIDVSTKLMFFLALVLGGMTIIFHNARFIQIKPTVVYWISSLVFLVAHIRGKNIPEVLFKNHLDFKVLPFVWKNISLAWIFSFLLLGILNIYVALYFNVDTWFYFKLYFVSAFLIILSIVQIAYLFRNRLSVAEETDDRRS